jgi:hypothetical protein
VTLLTWTESEKIDYSNIDGTEVLGLALDGSIRHFTVIDEATCEILRFLIDPSNTAAPVYWNAEPDPRRNSVNGDLLRPFLQKGKLEKMLEDVEEESKEKFFRYFSTTDMKVAIEKTMELLERLLRQIL